MREVIIAGLLRQHLKATEGDSPAARPARSRPTVERAAALPAPTVIKAPERERERERAPRRAAESRDVPPASKPVRSAPVEPEAERPKPERNKPDARSGMRRQRRLPDREQTFSEDGVSYQVREVSAADLAGVAANEPPPAPIDNIAAAPANATDSPPGWEGAVDEAFVNVGRDDGIRVSDLQQALGSAGLGPDDVAYVRVRQRHTFIGVRQGLLDQVVTGLSGQKLAERAVEVQPARPRQARR